MEGFAALDATLRRSRQAMVAACACLALLACASLAFALHGASQAREQAWRMPVLVVPGAISGTYTPGLADDNVHAIARYLATLATNYTGLRSFEERFDELEGFSSPTLLPRLQAARAALRRELETQNQSRTFVASSLRESFAQSRPGRFRYSARGERTVYASGLPMATSPCEVRLQLALGAPSEHNRLGVTLEGFEVIDDPRPASRSASPAAGA
jgi:hypothetical protein